MYGWFGVRLVNDGHLESENYYAWAIRVVVGLITLSIMIGLRK